MPFPIPLKFTMIYSYRTVDILLSIPLSEKAVGRYRNFKTY